jgi:hypothetical protein
MTRKRVCAPCRGRFCPVGQKERNHDYAEKEWRPMAIYHLSIKIITRGNGKSAVAAAAYRAGETIKNEYDGMVHDYTHKRGIVHTEILLPINAPAEYTDRSTLWNAVEIVEKQRNSQLAREIEVALPMELSLEQNISLVRRFVNETFVNAGMCADLCVHDKDDGNPHAHIMLTMRPMNEDGSWGAKIKKVGKKPVYTTDWNDRERAEDWRKAWAAYANGALRMAGVLTEENVLDHRSYERQGKEQIPTFHLGPAAHQMERRGIRTERGDKNREIEVTNKQIQQLRARINKLDKWIAEEAANTKPPTLAEVINNILERGGIHNLQTAAKVLIFLNENEIPDVAGLEKKVKSMRDDVNRIREDLKKVERRIDTLENHLGHSENLKNYRKIAEKRDALYAEYKTLSQQGMLSKGKAKKALEAADAFEWKHFNDLQDYDNAEKYLRSVLQGRFDPKKLPVAKWREELTSKTTERDSLYREYNSLKTQTQKVEQIRRSVTDIMRDESRERTRQKSQGMEL